MKKSVRVLILGLWLAAAPGRGDSSAPAIRSAEGLSDFSGGGYLLRYLGHRNERQEDRFVTEGRMELDFGLFSRSNRPALRLRFEMTAGMGKSVAEDLPFSPKEMAYEMNPFVEQQAGGLLFRAGLVHACQHLIYKDHDEPWYLAEGLDLPPDVYFNRLYAGMGRRESRREKLTAAYFGKTVPHRTPPLLWYVEAGGYLRSLGELLAEESLYGDNDWAADAKADVMVPVLVRPSVALFVASRAHVLFDIHDHTFWRERLEVENFFASRGFGSSAFLAWNVVDEHPRDSREGLWEVGARFFF